MKKIVIASDSYKGSVSSTRFADVCRNAILKESPGCEVICIPLGDGGEGTVEALAEAWHGQLQNVSVCDPLMRPVKAIYGISADGSAAIMEMAQASGLTLLGENERDPLSTTSYGTGEMIRDALHKGCRKILLGIGGSATNDGGMGMLSALGAEFFDINGNIISGKGCGRDLAAVSSISLSGLDPLILGADITVACDVDNPFCGSCGASRVFGRQKEAGCKYETYYHAGNAEVDKTLAANFVDDENSNYGCHAVDNSDPYLAEERIFEADVLEYCRAVVDHGIDAHKLAENSNCHTDKDSFYDAFVATDIFPLTGSRFCG